MKMGQVLSNFLRCLCICGEAEDESDQNPSKNSSHLHISPPIPPLKTVTQTETQSEYSSIDSSITTPFLNPPTPSDSLRWDSTSKTVGLHQILLLTSPRSVLEEYSQSDSCAAVAIQQDTQFSSSTSEENNLKELREADEEIFEDGEKVIINKAVVIEERWMKHYSSFQKIPQTETQSEYSFIDSSITTPVSNPPIPSDSLRGYSHQILLLSPPQSVLEEYSQRDLCAAVPIQQDTLFSSSASKENNLKELREADEGIEDGEKLIINKAVVIEERWMMHYSSFQKILLVGEGDFSFSACLATAFGSAHNIIATSLNSTGYLSRNYRRAMFNIQSLSSRGAKVMHEVDATQMANQILFQGMTFDRIVFNFPLSGFFPDDSRESKLRRERKLVYLFIANARKMITERGEIHVTHKSNGFFREWNLEELASSNGLQLIDEVHFNFTDFPGYHTKYGFRGDKNFNCNPSKTYKFGLKFKVTVQS